MADPVTLAGVRVLDLTRSMAGPWTSRMLADAGAEVIKVEPPMGDFIRHLPASLGEFTSGYFQQANSGKRSVCLDLHTAEGIDLVMELVPHADVVLHNMRPNAAQRLGLVAERVHELNPKAVFCQICGYGDVEELADKPGQDMAIQCMTGLSLLTGERGGEPAVPIWSMVDTLTSAYAFTGIAAALYARASNGLSRIAIQVSMARCAAQLHDLGPFLLGRGENVAVERRGQFHPFLVLRGVVATGDGYIAISAYRNRHWLRFAPLIGFGGELVSSDARRQEQEAIEARTVRTFGLLGSTEALSLLASAGVPAARVAESLEEVAESGYFQERAMLVPSGGGLFAGSIVHPDRSAAALEAGPPALGEAGVDVPGGLLGLSGDRILELLRNGVVACEPGVLESLLAACEEGSVANDVA